jgi:hypothetical protein
MHQRKYPTEGNDLGLTPPGNQTDPDQDAEKRGDTSETIHSLASPTPAERPIE